MPLGLVQRAKGGEGISIGVERVNTLQEPVPAVVGRKSVNDPAAGTAETDGVYTHMSPRSSSEDLCVRSGGRPVHRARFGAAISELVEPPLPARNLRTGILHVPTE